MYKKITDKNDKIYFHDENLFSSSPCADVTVIKIYFNLSNVIQINPDGRSISHPFVKWFCYFSL